MLDVRTPAGWASMAVCGKIPLTTTIAEHRVQTNSRNGEMIFDFLLVNCLELSATLKSCSDSHFWLGFRYVEVIERNAMPRGFTSCSKMISRILSAGCRMRYMMNCQCRVTHTVTESFLSSRRPASHPVVKKRASDDDD